MRRLCSGCCHERGRLSGLRVVSLIRAAAVNVDTSERYALVDQINPVVCIVVVRVGAVPC